MIAQHGPSEHSTWAVVLAAGEGSKTRLVHSGQKRRISTQAVLLAARRRHLAREDDIES